MKLKDVKEVLTFAAFRLEPDDSTAPWSKRFPRQRTLLLNVGRDGVSWKGVDKGGILGDGGYLPGELKELATDMAEEWKSLTDDGWCAVSVNHRFVISLETNLTRKNGSEELIRTNPKAALGSKAERGKRYAVKHNPVSNTSVLLSVDEEFVKSIESSLAAVGLETGRISCGLFGMFSDAIDQMAEAREQFAKSQPDQKLGKIVILACCEGSVSIMTSDEERWVELRSRSGLYTEEDLEPVLKIIMPLFENAGSEAQVVFIGDNTGIPIKEMLSTSMPNRRISDVSQPDQLWSLLKEK